MKTLVPFNKTKQVKRMFTVEVRKFSEPVFGLHGGAVTWQVFRDGALFDEFHSLELANARAKSLFISC